MFCIKCGSPIVRFASVCSACTRDTDGYEGESFLSADSIYTLIYIAILCAFIYFFIK